MSKKFSKILLTTLLLVMVMLSSISVCFATEEQVDNTTTETAENSEASDTTTEQQEIYSGDLYLFDSDVTLDKLVDGNVFIIADNVEIKGQVNGNLFVLANSINFNECYVRYSIFACANSVYYNGACNDLYVAASSNLEMTYDSYVVRDVKALSSNVIFKSAIGRDVDLSCKKVDFGEGDNVPIIYGNLRYSANSEATIPEGVISGDGSATFTPAAVQKTTSVKNIVIGFLTAIVTVLVVYSLAKVFAPGFVEKLSNTKVSLLGLLKALAIGLVSLVVVGIVSIIVLATFIGSKLVFILLALYVLLFILAVPTFTVVVTNTLKPVLKVDKTSMYYLVLVLVSVILYGVTLIPFVGMYLSIIITLLGLGTLIDMFLPKKELSEAEIAVLEEAKKLANERREAAKQEKQKAKEAKKQEKLAEKENKKKE